MKGLSSFLVLLLVSFLPLESLTAQWSNFSSGLTTSLAYTFAGKGSDLFVGTDIGVFHRTDGSSAAWELISNGLNYLCISSITVKDTFLFLGLNGGLGVYRSSDNGAHWSEKDSGFGSMCARDFCVLDSNLFAAADDGIFLTTNNGDSWQSIGDSIYVHGWTNVSAIATVGRTLFAGTSHGVYVSAQGWCDWTRVDSGFPRIGVRAFAVCYTEIFAATFRGVYRSSNHGINWEQVNYGLTDTTLYALIAYGKNLFAGAYGGGVFVSSDRGMRWTNISTGFENDIYPSTRCHRRKPVYRKL